MRISDWSSDVCSSDLADRPGLACPGKDKVELAGDRIILEERLADRAVHFRLGPRVELQAELAEHVDQNREIRRPIEIRIGRAEEEIEVLGKTRTAKKEERKRVMKGKSGSERVDT